MSVIRPNLVLIDRYGTEWRPAPMFQDRDSNAYGFLLLQSSGGVEWKYGTVLDLRGLERQGKPNYLLGRYLDLGEMFELQFA